MIYLRQADEADAHALARLRAASLIELQLLSPGDEAAFVTSAAVAFRQLFSAGRLVAWLACADARAVGSCCAVFFDRLPYPDGTLHAEISGVYTEPAHRGRGYAAELTREVMAAVRARGTRKMFLRPSPPAVPLYERLGFVLDGSGTMTV